MLQTAELAALNALSIVSIPVFRQVMCGCEGLADNLPKDAARDEVSIIYIYTFYTQ